MPKRVIVFSGGWLFFIMFPCIIFGQPTWTIDPFGKEKKPEKFENRKLGSEKTAEKKFTLPRKVIQNNITHYNYYYNANNKVNTVVESAKLSYKDDFSSLLSFYPYSLATTATQKTELDSVIYTSTAGILLHDLRNDWIDNMYLLIGKAYFFRKEFDSAAMTFQFINYNLFPRKRKNDDDDRIVGTNSSAVGNVISVANKEQRNILQKVVSLPPSRNDALIWLARTLTEQGEFGEAGGLINTLQNDPNLPKRLYNDLEEVNAYWFYKQAIYDSAAVHLEKALSSAGNKQDRSRWEFLLAQLYEMNQEYDKASEYYIKASKHTVDPLLDIYARLNEAKMLRNSDNAKELDKSISNLLKMARKDKFDTYRDIIYYAAGQLSMQKPDTNAAVVLYHRSLKYNEANIPYKNRTYIQLGDIAYMRKQYREAHAFYDSIQAPGDSALSKRIEQIQVIKKALSKIADAIANIEREDSLQRIAAMQPDARDEFVKKLLRQLRKEKGLKEESIPGEIIPFSNNTNAPPDLFATNTRGEWYFYNNSAKSKGYSEFKSKWGNRANTDNWRRKEGREIAPEGRLVGNIASFKNGNPNITVNPEELSLEGLMKNLPITEEKLKASNNNIAINLIELGKLYQNELEEYQLAIDTYEDYLRRFPNRLEDGEIYLNLYYCYTKLNNTAKANYYRNILNTRFANTKYAQILNNPAALNPATKNPEVTKLYEDIYTLFIEGNFDKAIAEKKKADSLYGVNYWTPQLLYIEALHYIKEQNDSTAINTLQTLMTTYPTSPLAQKAGTVISVVKRRKEIEKYLTDLQVTRMPEDAKIIIPEDTLTATPAPISAPAPVAVTNPTPPKPAIATDTVKKIVAPPLSNGTFTLSPTAPHYVIMILDNVDGVYINEAKNALARYNKENYYGQTIEISRDQLEAGRVLLLISSFTDATVALEYYDKLKKNAAAEISWLPANKYSFLIITEANLQLLKTNKNISGYKSLLNAQYPNRF